MKARGANFMSFVMVIEKKNNRVESRSLRRYTLFLRLSLIFIHHLISWARRNLS